MQFSSQDQFNPIACENCRNKKCKCDRELPSCSQCLTSGANCRYPLNTRRGIPTGYISSIEQRLVETEVALFELLSSATSSGSNGRISIGTAGAQAIAQHNNSKSKFEKIEEWKEFPLGTEEARREWWQSRAGILDFREQGTSMVGESGGVGGIGEAGGHLDLQWLDGRRDAAETGHTPVPDPESIELSSISDRIYLESANSAGPQLATTGQPAIDYDIHLGDSQGLAQGFQQESPGNSNGRSQHSADYRIRELSSSQSGEKQWKKYF